MSDPSVPANEIAICPDCGSTQFQIATVARAEDIPRYRCPDCRHRFEDFETRDRDVDGIPRNGLAADLFAATDGECRICGVSLGAGYLCDDCER